jgi:hypothetical protein
MTETGTKHSSLLCSIANQRYGRSAQDRKVIGLGANTLAYFAGASVTMNKRLVISAQDRFTKGTNTLAYTDKASEAMNKIFTISAQDRKSHVET